MRIKKKDVDYFEYFCTSARIAAEAAKELDNIIRSYSRDSFKAGSDRIHELEHAADANRHKMIEALAKEFIPPIEREDIMSLSHQLDNVVDAIDDVALSMYMFNVESVRPEALMFSELIVRCCEALLDTVAEFRNFKNSKTLKEKVIAVNTLESNGDTLHTESVRKLFAEKTDPTETIVWMKIFDEFEDCLDACEDVVDIIEGVILKNS